ncbi:ATP-binding protein [Streptomyces sp. NPDC048420]|uniref:ATP-binding protein n=1 Tax=Streptomyces sp. NPDC048420 TaxID=3155755 RepID=UPI0034466475
MSAPHPLAHPAPRVRSEGKHRADRLPLEAASAAVAVPLFICLIFFGIAVTLWRITALSVGHLLAVVLCGLLVACVDGARRVRAVAKAVTAAFQASEAEHLEKLTGISSAVAALDTVIQFTTDELRRGSEPPMPEMPAKVKGAGRADEIVTTLGDLQVHAVAALIRVHQESRPQVLLKMMSQFARREHVLLEKSLAILDGIQRVTEDPDQLEVLYRLDHLVTRLRRWVETKAAAGGESLRSAPEPIGVTQLLRGAIQEIEHFQRVDIAAGTVRSDLRLPQHVASDVTHLLAELIDNATNYCDRSAPVQVRASRVPTGLAVEVEDRVTIPMTGRYRTGLNRLLHDPSAVDVSGLIEKGQLGLLVAAKIAQVHSISIELKENAVGGTTALVVIPDRLLVTVSEPVPGKTSRGGASVPSMPHHAPKPAPTATPVPAPMGAAAAPMAQPAGAPPLPQRVPSDLPGPRPRTPSGRRTRPQFGLAGEISESMESGRTAERSAPDPPYSHQ